MAPSGGPLVFPVTAALSFPVVFHPGETPFLWLYFFLIILAVPGRCCCMQAFSSCSERGATVIVLHELLIAVASLVSEHGLYDARASVVVVSRLWNTGSIIVAHGLSCSAAYRVFLDQGSNPSPELEADRFFTTKPAENYYPKHSYARNYSQLLLNTVTDATAGN